MIETLSAQIMVRVFPSVKEKIREAAKRESEASRRKVTDGEIIRRAVELFLSSNFTDSKGE